MLIAHVSSATYSTTIRMGQQYCMCTAAWLSKQNSDHWQVWWQEVSHMLQYFDLDWRSRIPVEQVLFEENIPIQSRRFDAWNPDPIAIQSRIAARCRRCFVPWFHLPIVLGYMRLNYFSMLSLILYESIQSLYTIEMTMSMWLSTTSRNSWLSWRICLVNNCPNGTLWS